MWFQRHIRDRPQLLGAGATFVAIAVMVAIFLVSGDDAAQTPASDGESETFEAFSDSSENEAGEAVEAGSDPRPDRQPSRSERDGQLRADHRDGSAARETSGGDEIGSDDAGRIEEDDSVDEEKEEEHRPDGVGPTAWMAETDDIDVDALEEELLDGEMSQEFELAMREDRHSSIDTVDDYVHDCYRELDTRQLGEDGRVALQWTITTSGGVGTIADPQILHQLGGRDEQFEECVRSSVDGLVFDAVGDGAELDVRSVFIRR